MKAVIMAAGYGTRFLPFTKAVSKTMLPIIDKPTIQLIVEEALESGIDEILIIVGANKDAIIRHFSKDENLQKKVEKNREFVEILEKTNLKNIKFVEQKVLNGTGGAIMLAKEFVGDQPFLLMFADDLFVGKQHRAARHAAEGDLPFHGLTGDRGDGIETEIAHAVAVFRLAVAHGIEIAARLVFPPFAFKEHGDALAATFLAHDEVSLRHGIGVAAL